MHFPLTDIVNFTPGSALAGGLLIGAGAVVLLAGIGRIAGISGILHGLFRAEPGHGWRLSFLLGLLGEAFLYVLIWPTSDIAARTAINPREAVLFVLAVIVGGWAMRLMDTRRAASRNGLEDPWHISAAHGHRPRPGGDKTTRAR